MAVVVVVLACSFDESNGLAGKLKKLFKKSKKNCDIIWTEHIHPHCETTTEQMCQQMYKDECKEEMTEECSMHYEEVCHTEMLQECMMEYRQDCKTEQIQRCKMEYTTECSSTPHCETIEEEKCSTKYQKICDKDIATPKEVKVVVEKAKEKWKRSLPEDEDEVEGPETQSAHNRKRRFALLKKIFGKKKKVEEVLCHHIPHKHCVMVPVQKCHAVEECWQEPKEECWDEPHEECWQEPEEKCVEVPHETCHQEPRQTCEQVPHRECWQEPHEVCKAVPREHCEYLPKLVAKKKCDQPERFTDRLRKLVTW